MSVHSREVIHEMTTDSPLVCFQRSFALPTESETDAAWFERIEHALRERGQTKYWLATQMGLQASRMTHWKQGRGKPDLHQAWCMAKLLDVPLDWLADPGDAGSPPPTRSEEERILLDAVRDIGPMAALRILVKYGGQTAQPEPARQSQPIRSVEIKHRRPSSDVAPEKQKK